MKITNAAGLPKAVFEALDQKEYSSGNSHISVTSLIDSPRVRALKQLHNHEIEIEADTLLAAALGTAFHQYIEKGTKTGTAERRLSIEVNGWKLSGGMDHYHDGVLTDYKTATCFKVSLDCPKGRVMDWENQLNVYAHILRENGHPVTKLMLFCLFKDWNKRSFTTALKSGKIFDPGNQGGYPDKTWVHFEVPLWSEKQAADYILSRVKLHQEAEKTLPLCTEKEIWRGNRCTNYCNVNKWCTQYQEQIKTGLVKQGE